LQLIFSKTDLQIFIDGQSIKYDINVDIEIEIIRNEFNEKIASIALEQHDKLEYWLLRISERNTMGCDLFLDICYLLLIQKYYSLNKNIHNVRRKKKRLP